MTKSQFLALWPFMRNRPVQLGYKLTDNIHYLEPRTYTEFVKFKHSGDIMLIEAPTPGERFRDTKAIKSIKQIKIIK